MCSNSTYASPARAGKTIFSLTELRKLLEQENSCVSCVTCQRSINITPIHLADFKTSIRDLLDEKVNLYDVELEGVVLAQKNVKIVAESVVLSDSRYFPLDYIADIYVFKPKIGSKLTGMVNKMPLNREYVSVLVHNIFNVVVYAAPNQPKPTVKIGSSINVTVTYIDFTGRLPFIKGEISSKNSKKVLEEADGSEEEMFPPQPLQTPIRKGLTSILKNSPSRVPMSSTDVETESSSTENGSRVAGSSGSDRTKIGKKKKKRDKERKGEKTDEAIGDEKCVESPSKKRKRSYNDGGESPSSSKKKKKHVERSVLEVEDTSLNDTCVNPLENTVQIMADQSIFKAASSTPVLGSPSKKKKKKKKSKESKTPFHSQLDLAHSQQDAAGIKSELKTGDSGISSSDEKKIKVKRESVSEGELGNTTGSKSKEESRKKKESKKKKKEKKRESTEDITRKLLEEALNELKTEK